METATLSNTLLAEVYQGRRKGKPKSIIPIDDLTAQSTGTTVVIKLLNGSKVKVFRSDLDFDCYNIATPLWAGFISFRNGYCISFATTSNNLKFIGCNVQLLGYTYKEIVMKMIDFSAKAIPVRIRYYSGAGLDEYNLIPYTKDAHQGLLALEQAMFNDPCYNANNGTMNIEKIFE